MATSTGTVMGNNNFRIGELKGSMTLSLIFCVAYYPAVTKSAQRCGTSTL